MNGVRHSPSSCDLLRVLSVPHPVAARTGWGTRATDISDDGTVITGHATNPAGNTEAWIAKVPEPASILLLGGLFLNLRLRHS